MKRTSLIMLAAVLAPASLCLAHPGHSVYPTHEAAHALMAVGAFGVIALAATTVWFAIHMLLKHRARRDRQSDTRQ